jgi:outer membrane protein assembly factor BamD (BamD/ComL family)
MEECKRGGVLTALLVTMAAFWVMRCSPVEVEAPDEQAYRVAKNLYYADNHAAAIDSLAAFIEHYPYSSRLDNARYYLARCYMKVAAAGGNVTVIIDYCTTAITTFNAIDWRSNQYVQGQYYAARSYERIYDATLGASSLADARAAYTGIDRRFGKTRWGAKARLRLELLAAPAGGVQ